MSFNKLMLIIVILFSVACSEDNNSEFEKINNNGREVVNLDNLDLDEQRLYFKSLAYQEKIEIWYNKFNILIKSSYDKKQREYLIEIVKDLNNNSYSKGITNNEFRFKWESKLQYLKSEFSWTDYDIFIVFSTLYTIQFNQTANKSSQLFEEIERIAEPGFSSAGCDCRWGGLGCLGEYCNGDSNCPADKDDELGCGFLWLQSCTGSCDY